MSGDDEKRGATPVAPAVATFGACGVIAIGFGAGYGFRGYQSSAAHKELLEKFPKPPTPEMEAFARSGASRALLAGTGLAGLMGIGAVLVARAYGITSIDHLGDEARRWLPTRQRLQETVAPKLEPLTRTVSNNLQQTRTSLTRRYSESSLGGYLTRIAKRNAQGKPLEDWERELLQKMGADEETKPAAGRP